MCKVPSQQILEYYKSEADLMLTLNKTLQRVEKVQNIYIS